MVRSAAAIISAAVWFTCGWGAALERSPCQRIVSLAPSVTEVLFELGLGGRVVGVSRFDRYPAGVHSLPRVGGLFDPHYEAIVGHRPTIVVALVEFGEKAEYLRSIVPSVMLVDHRSVAGILGSIEALGERCGVGQRARELRTALERDIAAVQIKGHGRPPVRTLVVVGGVGDGGARRTVFASGRDGFYDEILRLVGGVNVVTGTTVSLPTVSAEGLLALDPDVIIEVREPADNQPVAVAEIKESWQHFGSLRAVKAGRVHVLTDDFVTIPGPRFGDTLRAFAAIIAAAAPRSGEAT